MSTPALTQKPHLLAGKEAIITGGTTGIGLAITLSYLRHGCNVLVSHLNLPHEAHHVTSLESQATAIQSSDPLAGRLTLVVADVREPSSGAALVAHALKTFGTEKIDIAVANAGICEFKEFLDIEAEMFQNTVNTNLGGTFHFVQACARQMSSQSPTGGSIIGISSISALVGGGQQCHYTPTKAGILSLMQSCACALGKYNIRCNALLPGTIRTRLNEEDLAGEKGDYMSGRIPLGRVGETEDMAGPAVFLGSEELSGFVTGSSLLVDGGLFVNLQ